MMPCEDSKKSENVEGKFCKNKVLVVVERHANKKCQKMPDQSVKKSC